MAFSFTWMNLPIDILPQICEKLDDIADRIRFGAVCHEWRKIHWRCRKSIPPQPPMLLLPKIVDKKTNLLCLDIKSSTSNRHGRCNIPLPLKHSNDSYTFSKNGWLLALSKDKVELLNPFLSFDNIIQLPTLPKDIKVLRAVLSHSPTQTSNYVVFIIYALLNDPDNMNCSFAYFKSGEKSWTSVHVGLPMYDAIYYNDQFYALCYDEGLVCCDIKSSTQEPIVTTLASLPNISVPENLINGREYLDMQLLESRGELLCIVTKYKLKKYKLISRILRLMSTYFSDEEQGDAHFPIGFQIFKYDTKDNAWKEQKSLKGGEAIFVGLTSSLSIDVSNFPSCMSNHIYFHHFGFDDIKVGVFNLEDASFKFIDCKQDLGFGSKGWIIRFRYPIWVQPTLNIKEPVIFSDSGGKRMLMKVENNELDNPYVWDSPRKFLIMLFVALVVAIVYLKVILMHPPEEFHQFKIWWIAFQHI